MNLIIYLIAAAIIGWVASEIMHDRSGLLFNIIVAVVGAFLAGYFLSPLTQDWNNQRRDHHTYHAGDVIGFRNLVGDCSFNSPEISTGSIILEFNASSR